MTLPSIVLSSEYDGVLTDLEIQSIPSDKDFELALEELRLLSWDYDKPTELITEGGCWILLQGDYAVSPSWWSLLSYRSQGNWQSLACLMNKYPAPINVENISLMDPPKEIEFKTDSDTLQIDCKRDLEKLDQLKNLLIKKNNTRHYYPRQQLRILSLGVLL